MGHSPLVGVDRADPIAPGTDTASLGPGDTSDSGSDMAGLDAADTGDPGLPVDVAMDDAHLNPLQSSPSHGTDGDAAGTGERRAAGDDAGVEAGDIGVDRVFEVDGREHDDEDPDLAFTDPA